MPSPLVRLAWSFPAPGPGRPEEKRGGLGLSGAAQAQAPLKEWKSDTPENRAPVGGGGRPGGAGQTLMLTLDIETEAAKVIEVDWP